MEKVPNLNIFSQRQLKKSSSASRISYDNGNRPSSTLNPSTNNNAPQNFYGQALKLLNTDSKITTQLKNIQTKYDEDGWKKTNIRKIAKRQPFEQPLVQSNTHFTTNNVQNIPHQPIPSVQVQMNQPPKIYFNQCPNTNRMAQAFKPVPVFIPPGNSFQQAQLQQAQTVQHFQQTQQIPFHIIAQNQQNHHQNNARLIQTPSIVSQNLPPSIPMQRRNSAQQIGFGGYSQADKMMSQCNVTPICNNQQEKHTQNTQDRKQYTFCNKTKADSPHKTYNPFLFDATYLLQIKQSESRLPDITCLVSNKQYSQEIDKKQQLLEQLYQIREENIVESNQFLRQLDCLIHQFQSKQSTVKPLEESVMRNSRRSLFSKIE